MEDVQTSASGPGNWSADPSRSAFATLFEFRRLRLARGAGVGKASDSPVIRPFGAEVDVGDE